MLHNADQLDQLTNSPAMLKVDFFNDELDLIEDEDLRAMVRTALDAAPAYFWTEPCSVTGKYHPDEDNVAGGIPIHSVKVSWLAYRFADMEFGDNSTIAGQMVGAALLHDICCKGTGDTPDKDSWKTHGKIAAEWLTQFDILKYHAWTSIKSFVLTHMGRFGDVTPATKSAWMLHLADAAASCKHFVSLKFYNPEAAPAISALKRRGNLYKDDEGDWIIGFGKYAKDGETVKLKDLASDNPSYLRWLLDNTEFLTTEQLDLIKEALETASAN